MSLVLSLHYGTVRIDGQVGQPLLKYRQTDSYVRQNGRETERLTDRYDLQVWLSFTKTQTERQVGSFALVCPDALPRLRKKAPKNENGKRSFPLRVIDSGLD